MCSLCILWSYFILPSQSTDINMYGFHRDVLHLSVRFLFFFLLLELFVFLWSSSIFFFFFSSFLFFVKAHSSLYGPRDGLGSHADSFGPTNAGILQFLFFYQCKEKFSITGSNKNQAKPFYQFRDDWRIGFVIGCCAAPLHAVCCHKDWCWPITAKSPMDFLVKPSLQLDAKKIK